MIALSGQREPNDIQAVQFGAEDIDWLAVARAANHCAGLRIFQAGHVRLGCNGETDGWTEGVYDRGPTMDLPCFGRKNLLHGASMVRGSPRRSGATL